MSKDKVEKIRDWKAEYRDGPHHCPSCGSRDIEGGNWEFDDTIQQKVTCNECESVWWDVYRFAEFYMEVDNRVK